MYGLDEPADLDSKFRIQHIQLLPLRQLPPESRPVGTNST